MENSPAAPQRYAQLSPEIPCLGIHARELKTHIHTHSQQPASLQPRRNHPRPSVGEVCLSPHGLLKQTPRARRRRDSRHVFSQAGIWTSRIGALAASMSKEDHLPVQRQHLLPALHRVGGARELLGSFYKGRPHRTGSLPEAPPPSPIPPGVRFRPRDLEGHPRSGILLSRTEE